MGGVNDGTGILSQQAQVTHQRPGEAPWAHSLERVKQKTGFNESTWKLPLQESWITIHPGEPGWILCLLPGQEECLSPFFWSQQKDEVFSAKADNAITWPRASTLARSLLGWIWRQSPEEQFERRELREERCLVKWSFFHSFLHQITFPDLSEPWHPGGSLYYIYILYYIYHIISWRISRKGKRNFKHEIQESWLSLGSRLAFYPLLVVLPIWTLESNLLPGFVDFHWEPSRIGQVS